MRCEELRERFSGFPDEELARHLEGCPQCRQDWLVFQEMLALKAPVLDAAFDRAVLEGLQSRGYFEPSPPTLWQRASAWLARAIPPAAVLASLLLLLWLGDLAATRPGADVRALSPDTARMWSRLPDAVPSPTERRPAPPGSGTRVGKERHEKDS